MKRLFTSIICLIATALSLCAQNTIKVSVQNLVALDEQFNISFIIDGEGKVSDFQWSPGEDFQLVWGPQKGSSSSISIINGKKTQSSQTTYTYVLMPRSTGTFQLPAASATIKGETITSKRVSIQVVSNGASAQSGGQAQQGGSTSGAQQGGGNSGANAGTVPSEDIFLRLSLSKTKAVVGETISATLKLFHRVNIGGFEDARFPTFNGFWSQEVQAPTNIEFHRESVGDKIYNAAVLRSWTLIPQQAGEVVIDPAELVCLVNVRNQNSNSGSIFDSFFQDEYRTIRKRVTTPAIKVQVSKIPAGAPASFGGGVGTFRMTAALTRDSLRTHDAAALKVTISGKGNISLLEAPKINFPPDFEVYDVKTSEGGGSKTFEYPFIPRSHGEFVLGPVEYSYYDVAGGKFVTLRSAEMPIKVSKGEDSAPASGGGQLVVNPNRKDVRDLGSDIRFIATKEPALTRAGYFFAGSGLFWAIAALLCLIAAAVYFLTRKLWERRADVAGTKNRAATKMARKRLSQAGEFLRKDLYTAFYEELHKALLGFVSDKLNMPAADLSKENIAERLVEGGATADQAARFTELLDACEFARYAPSEGHEAMNSHYEGAVSVISEIDSSMKHKSRGGAAAALIAMLMVLPLGVRAQAPSDQLWDEGVTAYSESRWQDAADSWMQIAQAGQESASLYYNIGNAFYKGGDVAHAILWYERALKVDPSYEDARVNLAFVRTQIQDRIEDIPEFFLKSWARKLCWLLPSNAWAVLTLVLLGAVLACLLLFLLGRGGARKAGFFSGLVALILCLMCFWFAFWQRSEGLSHQSAIVTAAVSEVKSSPGSGVSLFVLHEGTKVKTLETVGDWQNIELADGRQGWIPSGSITVI